jgi:hypothetical protein
VSRLFVIFMIVLLPLRGWAGDLMSLQMAMSGAAPGAASAMPADCPMHSQADASSNGADDAPMPAGMQNCSSCELCIPMAELAEARLDLLTFAAHAKPLMGRVDFISAAAAPTLKPPIS